MDNTNNKDVNEKKEKGSLKERLKLSHEQNKIRKASEKAKASEVKPEDAKFYRTMTLVMTIIAIVLIAGTVISLAVASVNNKKKASRMASFKQVEAITNVSTEEVSRTRYNESVHLNANLKSLNGLVNIYSPVYGKLQSNEVRLGDRVKKDDVLGYVDASDIGVDYEKAPVYALSDGIITAINAVRGDTVPTSTVLYTIAPEASYVLQGSISEKDLGSVKVGDKATFTTVSYPGITFNATLHYVAPIVNETSRTAALEFDVEKDENYSLLRPGMFVSVNAESGVLDDVITVQNSAVSTYLDETVVYKIEKDANGDDIAKRTVVTVSRSNGSVSVITSGLNVGDRVVVAGSVRDGEKVNVLSN